MERIDFSIDETTQNIINLISRILKERPQAEHWEALSEAGVPSLVVSEQYGGSGLGFVEACFALEAAGCHVACLPLDVNFIASLAIEYFGDEAQKKNYLEGVAKGQHILTIAPPRQDSEILPQPQLEAVADGKGWQLTGTVYGVPWHDRATALLVAANIGETTGLFLVRPDAAICREQTALTGQKLAQMEFAQTPAERIGARSDQLVWLQLHSAIASGFYQLGLVRTALKMTADYTTTRQQFGRPIGAFQAVRQQIADAYIFLQAMDVTLRRAVFRLAHEKLDLRSCAIACYWSSRATRTILETAQHLHGGMGFDRTYPLHLYFLHGLQARLAVGAADGWLAELGQYLANQNEGDQDE